MKNKFYIIICVIVVVLCIAMLAALKSASGKRVENVNSYSQSAEAENQT